MSFLFGKKKGDPKEGKASPIPTSSPPQLKTKERGGGVSSPAPGPGPGSSSIGSIEPANIPNLDPAQEPRVGEHEIQVGLNRLRFRQLRHGRWHATIRWCLLRSWPGDGVFPSFHIWLTTSTFNSKLLLDPCQWVPPTQQHCIRGRSVD